MNFSRLERLTGFVTQRFVLWVLLAVAAALIWPAAFTWFQPLIVPGLGLIMFGMGTALTPADFNVWRNSRMPSLSGWRRNL